MPDENEQKPVGAVEANLFSTLFGFHEKLMRLLRSADLEDDKLDLAAQLIKAILERITAEAQENPGLDLAQRLDAAYREVEAFVDQASDAS